MTFDTLLIANRGEIAVRIIRTARELGLRTVAVFSDADRSAPHVRLADEAVRLGPAPAKESYLDADLVLKAAKDTGAGAIHPGYGFLSEDAEFARRCEDAGIVFVGPTADQLELFGAKHTARAAAEEAGVPLAPGTGLLPDLPAALTAADRIGYPVMLKATGGGGGIGMSACRSAEELTDAWERVQRVAAASFSSAGSSWSGSSSTRGMWRCRSSATAGAAWSPSATATARSSAATRRSWRRPRPGPPGRRPQQTGHIGT